MNKNMKRALIILTVTVIAVTVSFGLLYSHVKDSDTYNWREALKGNMATRDSNKVDVASISISQIPGCFPDCEVDIVLVLDTSNSMNDVVDGVPKIEILKNATNNTVDNICTTTGVQLGIVTYNTTSTRPYTATVRNATPTMVLIDDALDKAGIQGIIATLTAGGCTPMGYGISNGTAMLQDYGRPDVPDVMIIISDGEPTFPTSSSLCFPNDLARNITVDAANYAKSLGITIVTVYTGDGSGDADEWLRDNIASDPSLFINASLAAGVNLEEKLAEVFSGICGIICPLQSVDKASRLVDPLVTSFSNETYAPPGGMVEFKVNLSLRDPGGVVNLTLTDELPLNTVFMGSVTLEAGPGVMYDSWSFSLSGSTLTIDVVNLNITTSPTWMAFYYNVTLNNLVARGDVLVNSVNASILVNNTVDCFRTSSTTIIVVEPNLSIQKAFNMTTLDAANIRANITITLTNTDIGNTTTAYDVVITDTMPPGLRLLDLTYSTTGAVVTSVTWDSGGFEIVLSSMDVGGSITIELLVELTSSVLVNSTITNTASYTASSMPGTNAYEKSYSGSDSDTIRYEDTVSMDKKVRRITPSQTPFADSITAFPGSQVEYKINITVPYGTIPEMNVTDPLPPELTLLAPVVVEEGPGVTIAGTSTSTASNTLRVEMTGIVNSNSPYSWIVIRYNATISLTVPIGSTINNTATTTWRDGGGDQWSQRDTSTITIEKIPIERVTPTKAVKTTTPPEHATTSWSTLVNAVPGSDVEYMINVTVPMGVADNMTITDTLSTWLIPPSPADITVTLGPGVSASSVTKNVVGQTVEVVLENVTNTGPDDSWIAVTFPAIVRGTTYQGLVIPDKANVTWFTDTTIHENETNYANISVIEQDLVITKTASPDTIYPGDTAVFTIRLENQGDATAYDIRILDEIPTELVVNSVTITSSSGVTGVVDSSAGNTVDISIATMAPGGFIEIEVEVSPAASTPTNILINNTANYTSTSMPGSNANEKSYYGEDYALLKYCARLDVDKTVRRVSPLEETVFSNSTQAPPGGIVEYQINVTVPMGEYDSLTIEDILPPYVFSLSPITITPGPGLSYDSATPMATLTWIVIEFENVSSSGSYILVTFQVRFTEDPNEGQTLTNTAIAYYNNTIEGNETCSYEDRDTAIVNIVEPGIHVTKTGPTVITGLIFNYTITICNTDTEMPLFNVVLTDTLPPQIQIVNLYLDYGPPGTATWFNSTYLEVTIPRLDPGECAQVIVETQIVMIGAFSFTNYAVGTGYSMPDDPAEEYTHIDPWRPVVLLGPVGGEATIIQPNSTTDIIIYITLAAALLVAGGITRIFTGNKKK
ncbi:MAG: isopeptide-forming domain-containing fimbrial protein [Desulfurococcales archaeon]|nr:isopeptide-forming domain-containing fimbrial protein [Desulfurococcales archaeon]